MVSWTEAQLEEFKRRNPNASISTIPKASTQSVTPSPAPSKTSSTSSPTPEELRWGKGMNKTEREFLNTFLLRQGWTMVEREAVKLRIGPPDQRCTYTPDFEGVHYDHGFSIIECKGAYEYEDSRVKRMAAAKWCQERGIGFLFAQKTKGGWKQEWLA